MALHAFLLLEGMSEAIFLLCIDINPIMNYTHQHHKCFVVVIHPHTPHVFTPYERQNEMMQIAV